MFSKLFPMQNFRSPAALACLLVVAVIGLALDLWTKYAAFGRLQPGEEYEVISGLLSLKLVTNYGAVFGSFQGQRALFVVVSIIAIGFLLYLFANSGRLRIYQMVLGGLVAGVLGNMYDRVVYGKVRDMIYILPRWDIFPWIFNIADVLLCVGVGSLLIIQMVWAPEEQELAPGKPAEDRS